MMTSIKKQTLYGVILALSIPAAQAVDFGVFGDVSYHGYSPTLRQNDKRLSDSFAQGQFDLYATQKIDPETKVFVEIVYEDGGEGYGLDLERLNIAHEFTPNFSLAFGRFHTPIGYWNTAYHHGALIQDTVSRPTFLNFEDGYGAILPMHIIGLMGSGKTAMAGGDLHYDLMVGNSPSINTVDVSGLNSKSTIDVNNVLDPQDQKMVGVKAAYKLSALPLEVGAFALHDSVGESAQSGGAVAYGSRLVAQSMAGVHFRYATPDFDMLGEYYGLNDDDKVNNTGKHKASAAFVQFGYRATDKWKPIYRYETVDFAAADPYFQYLGTPEGHRHVLDLRHDMSDTNAIKFEVGRFEPVNSSDTNKSYTFYALQWAFMML